ncbi:MAG TPA: choice-of-anchor tandem repeat GloVer-containing protein [Rhizomicrobium sp.]|jgi:uncharacterized repeat protein (TIGR03803 family)|nr:choice-of-anchor tandem repeat GloVer-containing protein [Rhizomicrobium sp.]
MKTARHFRLALLSASVALAFAADISPAQAWKYKTLYKFMNGADGSVPNGGLLRNSATGNLYGVTERGGVPCDEEEGDRCGVVFKLAPDGTETVLHAFTGGSDGAFPIGGLANDDAGNLYGTTLEGGDSDRGTVFKLGSDGSYTLLHTFDDRHHDSLPRTRLVWDSASGKLYGTAGAAAFTLTPTGKYSILHEFDESLGSLTLDGDHHIYGASTFGGDPDCKCGFVFSLTPKGDETVLYEFTKKQVGYPNGPLVIGQGGALYGGNAGPKNKGSFFRLTLGGKYHVLYRFDPLVFPRGDLAVDAAGAIYGSTDGMGQEIIFQINPDRSEQTLYSFENDLSPQGVIMDEAGNLYGETDLPGTIFELVK